MPPFLLLRNVSKSFPVQKNLSNLFSKVKSNKKVIDDVSLEVEQGEVLVLAGESGSGKTTLAKLIMGALTPDYGSIYFEGEDVQILKKRKKYYSLVQMIHQDPYSSLNPHMKIRDIVMEPLRI